MHESFLLYEFLKGCNFPETIRIVEGYLHESEEKSWSEGQIVSLHTIKDLPQIIARDENGNHFTIPLNYPEKIFEAIPHRCSDKYETVEELMVDFPKYVRSLRDIPHSGIKVGDVLCLEASHDATGCMEHKCKVAGTFRSITLYNDQVGPFESLEDVNPTTMQDIVEQHSLPTRVRVRTDATEAFNEANTRPRVIFKGLFTIEEKVHENVFIASTLFGKDLRVLKIPIDLEIRVRREDSKIDPNLMSEICRLIDAEVNLETAITTGNSGEVSWFFNVERDVQNTTNEYVALRPPLPPRPSSGGAEVAEGYQAIIHWQAQGQQNISCTNTKGQYTDLVKVEEQHIYERIDELRHGQADKAETVPTWLKDLSVSEVSELLSKLRLNHYVDKFAEQGVDGNLLSELDDTDMQDLGIKSSFHRKKLMMFIQKGWTPKE